MTARFRGSMLMLVFILAVCCAVKLTASAVRREMAVSANVQTIAMPLIQEDPVIQFRTEREKLRQMQKSQLNEIIYGKDTEADIISAAQEQLIRVLDTESKETIIEGLLHLRGFDSAIVTINGESANVLVNADTLDELHTAIILDIVVAETGFSGGNVKIIPIN